MTRQPQPPNTFLQWKYMLKMLYKYPQEEAVRHEGGDGILRLLFHTEFLCILDLFSFEFIYKNMEHFANVCVILAWWPCWSLFQSTFSTYAVEMSATCLLLKNRKLERHWCNWSHFLLCTGCQEAQQLILSPPRTSVQDLLAHILCANLTLRFHLFSSPCSFTDFLVFFSLLPYICFCMLPQICFEKSQYLNKRVFIMERFFCRDLCTSGKKCV